MSELLLGLEPEQIELFEKLVEATRVVDRRVRQPFMLMPTLQATLIQGNGFGTEVIDGDVETLVDRGLLTVHKYHSNGSGFNFLVSPAGFEAYEHLKTAVGSQFENVEGDVHMFMNAHEFRTAHPWAFAKWSEASELLWRSDSEQELSTIGHKCREAMQAFLSGIIERQQIPDVNPDVAKTRDRFSAIRDAHEENFGTRKAAFLDALFEYWKAVDGLVQRQEHAEQRQGDSLAWEDGRRAVFQSAIVMYEIDRAIS